MIIRPNIRPVASSTYVSNVEKYIKRKKEKKYGYLVTKNCNYINDKV